MPSLDVDEKVAALGDNQVCASIGSPTLECFVGNGVLGSTVGTGGSFRA